MVAGSILQCSSASSAPEAQAPPTGQQHKASQQEMLYGFLLAARPIRGFMGCYFVHTKASRPLNLKQSLLQAG